MNLLSDFIAKNISAIPESLRPRKHLENRHVQRWLGLIHEAYTLI